MLYAVIEGVASAHAWAVARSGAVVVRFSSRIERREIQGRPFPDVAALNPVYELVPFPRTGG